MINHYTILYANINKTTAPITTTFVENCIIQYENKTGKKPNVAYGGLPLDNEFEIEYIVDEMIAPYYLYVGHTNDVNELR